MKISKELISTLMIANLIASIFVVIVHYNSKSSINVLNGYDLNYYIQEAIANGFVRVSSPFFALLSGYFLVDKTNSWSKYQLMLKKKFHTLFIPYMLSSLIIYLSFIVIKEINNSNFLQQLNINSFIYNTFSHPISGQFWFLRDLLILIIISPLLFNIGKKVSYFLGTVLFLLWILNIQPFPIIAGWYLLNINSLFFFLLGGVLYQSKINPENYIFSKNKNKIIMFTVWLSLIVLRIFIDPDLNVWYVDNYTIASIVLYKLAILVGIISLLQISTFFISNMFFVYLSGLTFFVFLFHKIPLYYFTYLTEKIIADPYSFYLNFPLALLFSFYFAHILSNKLTRLYRLISGGRNPSKALKRVQ